MTTTASISNYKIYCNTEAAFVTGWDTAPLTYCPHNNVHSVDTGQLTTVETVINVNSNTTSIVTHYRIYCETEAAYVTGWSTISPTTCFNDVAHTVNTNSVQTLEVVNNSRVKIIEDSITIARNVKIEQIIFTNVADEDTVIYTFKYPISMYSFQFAADDTNKGDLLTIAANPNTPLGLITANINPGDTVIHPPAPIFTYGNTGFNVYVSNGTNLDDLGQILEIDTIAGTITVETAAVHSFSTSNTVLLMTYFIMNEHKIGSAATYVFGSDIIGGTSVAIGTEVHFTYKNMNAITELAGPKNLCFNMTFLF